MKICQIVVDELATNSDNPNMTKSIDEMIDNLIVKSEGAIKALKEIDTIQENLVGARAEIQKQIKICEENVKKYEEKKNVE